MVSRFDPLSSSFAADSLAAYAAADVGRGRVLRSVCHKNRRGSVRRVNRCGKLRLSLLKRATRDSRNHAIFASSSGFLKKLDGNRCASSYETGWVE
jgi:CelD/BcsL family acetyltransferase involved in cellulose biosynthesis